MSVEMALVILTLFVFPVIALVDVGRAVYRSIRSLKRTDRT